MVGEEDRAVLIILPQSLLDIAVSEMVCPALEVLNRFQIRDPVLEALAVAAAREIEDGCPSGGAYLDGIGLAVSSRLLTHHTGLVPGADEVDGLSGHRLKRVLSYIEDRLGAEMSLTDIAASAGLSASHLTTLFRKSMGLSVHQHVIRRRVERAKAMLQEGTLPIAEVALAVGFSHQSHMSRHMVRVLGMRPLQIRQVAQGGNRR
ncbi:helix-turn-helix transcriptional regulator [Terriglobus sp. ADX1]